MQRRPFRPLFSLAAALGLTLFALPASGQLESFGLGGKASTDAGAGQDDVSVQARLTPADAGPGETVTLQVSIRVPEGFYTYSTTSPFASTKLGVTEARGVEAVDEVFEPDRKPKTDRIEALGKTVEKFYDSVTWSRKYRIAEDAEPREVSIAGTLVGQYCNENRCIPIRPPRNFKVSLQGTGGKAENAEAVSKPQVHPYRREVQPERGPEGDRKPDPVKLRFELTPQDAAPGEEVTLAVTADLEGEWHTFALDHEGKGGKPTQIELAAVHGLEPVDDAFAPNKQPEVDEPLEGITLRIHHDEVTWSRRFRVAGSAEQGEYGVRGTIKYQVCRERCLPLLPVEFALGHVADSDTRAATGTGTTESAGKTEASSALGSDFEFDSTVEAGSGNLGWYLLFGFLGGLILNVMPCVLPVIAIKGMSLIQQAGEDRSRIFMLNLAYSAGVIAVFLLLASLVAGLGYGWGELFQSKGFLVAMACIIFAMGLCLLGVFEIPVPGFVGAAAGTQQQEGLSGAFLTGVFATILATPCSGPFLGATLAWAAAQPVLVTFLVFGFMGLGMAFPYLVIGVFPHAVSWLPKPGTWMVRVKEAAGFVLMATVIFFFYVLDESYTVPLLIMLLGLGIALWMLGNLYDHSTPLPRKVAVRIIAVLLAGLLCGLGLWMREPLPRGSGQAVAATNGNSGAETDERTLPWESFSDERLNEALSQRRTVLIDFTADW